LLTGHFAPVILARLWRPKVAWLLLLLAAYLPDIVEATIRQFGLSEAAADQYSHSVPWLLCEAAVLVMVVVPRYGEKIALVCAVMVFVHAPLDWLTGATKPLLWAWGPQTHIHLYARPGWDAVIEVGIVLGSAAILWRLRPEERSRRAVVLLVLLVAGQLLQDAYAYRPYRRVIRRYLKPHIRGAPTGPPASKIH
jgi:hypothetical protein